ncbi:hypothetical protein RM152_00640 [Pantoea agglomerans]|uniref:hypothetical protein n=1 Tax=Enterobacter agglomerans TaxID=549 RepID=UPI00289E2CB2|nr:hypothetical protein [Pantoea agglomerans]WNK62601.1 hypothetical protein RM152_00640 [Pantoea agglomerans]
MLINFSSFFLDSSLVNQSDKNGRTPIFYSSDPLFTEIMVANGANINHTDKFDRNSLFYPWPQDEKIIDLFFRSGIDLAHLDCKNLTSFSYSLFSMFPESFIKNINEFNLKEIKIANLYLSSSIALEKLIRHGIKIKLDCSVKIHYPPKLCDTEIKNALKLFIKNKVDVESIRYFTSDSMKVTSLLNYKNLRQLIK